MSGKIVEKRRRNRAHSPIAGSTYSPRRRTTTDRGIQARLLPRTWSRYLGIDFSHPWPKSPRKRAAMFAAAVLVAAPAPARLKESGPPQWFSK
ncbi:MAG: hypothetical protein GY782_09960 [Gammaproteobacteria bacterium]|nr:hypothetical protein [Gammaproteobacteria bacterium]